MYFHFMGSSQKLDKCNRVKRGGVPIFRECTRECLFLMEISSFPSMLFLVTGSHIPEYAIFSNRKSHDHDKQSLDQSDFRAMT